MLTVKGRVQQTVTGTPGTGAVTLSTASSGYQALAAGQDGLIIPGFFTDGTAWEEGEYTYTHSGTSLARTALIASSTGSAISLTSAAVFNCDLPSSVVQSLLNASQSSTPGGRLTTETGVAVSTSDRTAQASLYYTPFIHNVINLWDGQAWMPTVFAETKVTGADLTGLTSGKPYDVFAYLSSGAFAAELLVWTSDTARATAITLQDGRYCKSGDKTRLYLGTIYTTATTTTEDSAAKRYVFNAYNQVARPVSVQDSTASWTWATASTWHQVRANAANQIAVVAGLVGVPFKLEAVAVAQPGAGFNCSTSIGVDSTTTPATRAVWIQAQQSGTGVATPVGFLGDAFTAIGWHKLVWLEYQDNTGGTPTFFGATGGVRNCGVTGTVTM